MNIYKIIVAYHEGFFHGKHFLICARDIKQASDIACEALWNMNRGVSTQLPVYGKPEELMEYIHTIEYKDKLENTDYSRFC